MIAKARTLEYRIQFIGPIDLSIRAAFGSGWLSATRQLPFLYRRAGGHPPGTHPEGSMSALAIMYQS
jgi:hypothetical protein